MLMLVMTLGIANNNQLGLILFNNIESLYRDSILVDSDRISADLRFNKLFDVLMSLLSLIFELQVSQNNFFSFNVPYDIASLLTIDHNEAILFLRYFLHNFTVDSLTFL